MDVGSARNLLDFLVDPSHRTFPRTEDNYIWKKENVLARRKKMLGEIDNLQGKVRVMVFFACDNSKTTTTTGVVLHRYRDTYRYENTRNEHHFICRLRI